MKKYLILFFLGFTFSNLCYAQQIESEKSFWGQNYSIDGKNMSLNDLSKTLKSNQESFELLKKAKSNRTTSLILGLIGGGMIGYSAGSGLRDGSFNWTVASAGVGTTVLGFTIAANSEKKIKKAVDLYNSSIDITMDYQFKPEFKIKSNGSSVAVFFEF